MEIKNKSLMYECYKKGLFGNSLRTWYSIDDFKKSNFSGKYVSLRYQGENGGMFCAYNVTNVDTKLEEFMKKGADYGKFIVNESAPDELLLIQGEVMRNEKGLSLFYSKEKGKMRDCLVRGESVEGVCAQTILKLYLNDNSYSDMMELLDLYPNHIIEFSTYSICLGDCKHRNTVIWEVRNY